MLEKLTLCNFNSVGYYLPDTIGYSYVYAWLAKPLLQQKE